MKLPRKRQLWRYYLLAYYTIKYLVFRFKKWQHPKPLKVIYGALIGITTVSFLYLSAIVAVFAFVVGLAFFTLLISTKFIGKQDDFELYYFNKYYYDEDTSLK